MITRYAYLVYKRRKLQRFLRSAAWGRQIQREVLLRKLARNADSDFGRQHGFAKIRSVMDFRRQVPITTYEYFRPYVERVMRGDVSAMFPRGTRLLMFTMTSGTTGQPKYLPITPEFFHDYRSGWHLWGTGVFNDHPQLVRQRALQLASDWRQYSSPSGIPCGNISGLAAETRPRVTRLTFCVPSALSQIHNAAAKHYATLRVALAYREVGLLVTANPSTLIEFARRADAEKESLIRDLSDGTLSAEVPSAVRSALGRLLRPNRRRAQELDRLVERTTRLSLRDAWPELGVIAVWTGGSVGVFLPRLEEHYGKPAIRDHGLSASEGRMTLPLADGTSAGIIDFHHQFFEFLPEDELDSASPTVLEAHELEVGRNYFVLLTTSGGLYRYNIHDMVRCTGFEGEMPLLEFLNKGKSFSNITGEKLSEHQAIQAARQSFGDLDLPIATFTLAPIMEDRPGYVLLVERGEVPAAAELAQHLDAELACLNWEYAEKRASGRLLPLRVVEVPVGAWSSLRHERTAERGNFEEYKHPCLTSDLTFADRILGRSRSRQRAG